MQGKGIWAYGVKKYEGYGVNLLDLMVNGEFVDWGTYTNTHIYDIQLIGDGTPLEFEFKINDPLAPNNNNGYLTVDIYKWI